jgi:hypothetical protein
MRAWLLGALGALLLAGCGGGSSLPDAYGEGAACGGLLGLVCFEGYYCDWPADDCGAADATGVCRPEPAECAPGGADVCGCDGQAYDNACAAAQAGTDVAAAGGC